MKITRFWAMPNSETFEIPYFRDLILEYAKDCKVIVDPFANVHSIAKYLQGKNYISNDIDPKCGCDFSEDANDFLRSFKDASVDMVLYDPPYTPRQVKEVYNNLEKTVTIQDTQASYWSSFKHEIARVLKPNGICISFGWNTNGIGLENGCIIKEIVIIAHGGSKNDTLATVEIKPYHQTNLDLFAGDKND